MRWRAALAASAVLLGVVPAVASATAPPFRCRDVVNVGPWQRLPISAFPPIEGVASRDAVTGYSLAQTRPQNVVATNGKRLKVSTVSGCDWEDGLTLGLQPTADVPLTGTTSTIVSTAILPSGRVLAAVREGAGAASRPHVVVSNDGRSGYRVQDSGLPPQGAPRLLKAADDGRTIYLVLTPTASDETDVGGIPLPGLPAPGNPTGGGGGAGLLYASTDGGSTWSLRTSPDDLPGGGGGLDRLAIDHGDPNRLYAISRGLLLISTNGGGRFLRARINNDDVTAVETGAGGKVYVFTAGGLALTSNDGLSFDGRRTDPGITSAAFRTGSDKLAVETSGRLALLDPRSGFTFGTPGVSATRGSLLGDVSSQGSYHALSGHSLLRYADPLPTGTIDPPVSVGDLSVPPPPPGTITPSQRTVQLKVGASTELDYSLALPKSPTPLDLMFLIDTSGSMLTYIDNLKRNINKVTQTVQRAGIDLRVGVATLGTGTRPGEVNGPYVNPNDPNDKGPQLYELFRRIGPVDADFAAALGRVKVKQQTNTRGNPPEAQLAALEQVSDPIGAGIRDPRSTDAAPLFIVPPGQGAHWRPQAGIRRLVVHATDEAFDTPVGTPTKNGEPDFGHTIDLMNRFNVKQIGLTVGSVDSQQDLARIASGTRTFAPAGGADCGQDIVLPAGRPLVCDTEGDFSAIIGRLVRSLTDRQEVRVVARGTSPRVVPAIAAPAFRSVDVTAANTLPFRVTVSCKGQSVGRYTEDLVVALRDIKVASSRLTVDCLGPAAAAALIAAPAIPAGAAPPAAPPVAQAPAAVVPAPPAAQPQVNPQAQTQVQTQTQVNPMTAAAMQQQEELQLALALQSDDREQPGTELAMVNRRRSDEGAALVLLALAMTASAGLGLARLRTRPDPAVVRVRR
ncbi:MAG: hypothetical protein ABR614_00780 [Mycobacteriales bacterium]